MAVVDFPLNIVLNGEPLEVPSGATVADLMERLKLPARQCAVERNGQVVPRSRHVDTPLQQHDRIEIVTLVGGG